MAKTELITPVLNGPRFVDNAIPMAVLSDLTALAKLVTEVAKWIYLEEHPDRKRCPKGFASPARLKLASIAPGSAIPSIYLSDEIHTIVDTPSYAEYYQRASQLIIDVIADADDATPLPETYYALFDPIGRNLLTNEQMTVKAPHYARNGTINHTRRQELVAKSKVDHISGPMTIIGKIPETDVEKRTFQIEPAYGSRITAPIPPEHYAAIMEIQRNYDSEFNSAAVNAVVYRNPTTNHFFVTEVSNIEILDPMSPEAQIEKLSRLHDGWLDGIGKAPNPIRLRWLAEQFDRYYPDDVPQPHMYPTPEGDIQLEWTFNSTEAELIIVLASGIAEWLETDVATMGSAESEVDLNTPSGWQWLAEHLRTLFHRNESQAA